MVLGLDRPIPQGMTIEKTVAGGVPTEWAKPQGAPASRPCPLPRTCPAGRPTSAAVWPPAPR